MPILIEGRELESAECAVCHTKHSPPENARKCEIRHIAASLALKKQGSWNFGHLVAYRKQAGRRKVGKKKRFLGSVILKKQNVPLTRGFHSGSKDFS